MVCLIQVIQSFPFLPGLKDVPRRLKKFIDWNKVLSNTSCVERGEDARTRIGSDVCKKTIDQRVYAIKKPTAILQTKFLSRGMSSAMRSERQKKLSLLAGKLSIEKKVCGFELSSVEQKIYKSFGEKNLALCRFFSPSKVTDIFCINTRSRSNS